MWSFLGHINKLFSHVSKDLNIKFEYWLKAKVDADAHAAVTCEHSSSYSEGKQRPSKADIGGVDDTLTKFKKKHDAFHFQCVTSSHLRSIKSNPGFFTVSEHLPQCYSEHPCITRV